MIPSLARLSRLTSLGCGLALITTLAACGSDDDRVFDDERSEREGVSEFGFRSIHLDVPQHPSGFCVECEKPAVDGSHEKSVAADGEARSVRDLDPCPAAQIETLADFAGPISAADQDAGTARELILGSAIAGPPSAKGRRCGGWSRRTGTGACWTQVFLESEGASAGRTAADAEVAGGRSSTCRPRRSSFRLRTAGGVRAPCGPISTPAMFVPESARRDASSCGAAVTSTKSFSQL